MLPFFFIMTRFLKKTKNKRRLTTLTPGFPAVALNGWNAILCFNATHSVIVGDPWFRKPSFTQ